MRTRVKRAAVPPRSRAHTEDDDHEFPNTVVVAVARGANALELNAADPRLKTLAAQRVITDTTVPTPAAPPMPGTSVDPTAVTPPTRHEVKAGDGPTVEIGELQQRLSATGNPVSVTGMFDAATTAAVTAFQNAHTPPSVATGVADIATWAQLDALAPTLGRNEFNVVDVAGGGNQAGTTLGTVSHPTIKLAAQGAGVSELQQRLNQSPTVADKPAVTGVFDAATDTAVRQFQGTNPPLAQDGVVGPKTWARIDAVCVGSVDQGREATTQSERVEGQEFIVNGNYAWRIDDAAKQVTVTVNLQFTENPTHPMVAQWVGDIKQQWNAFLMADKSDPTRAYKLEFDPNVGGTPPDATVAVDTTPFNPANPGATRSNAGRFFTVDTRRSLAPHEFGHLIGLADEYNNPEEQYHATTGEQVHVGDVSNAFTDAAGAEQNRATPESIAHDMGTVLRSSPSATRPQRLKAIKVANGLAEGGFSRRVAAAYKEEFAGKMKKGTLLKVSAGFTRQYKIDPTADIADDITARLPGSTSEQVEVTEVFLNTNNSLMGDMTTVDSTTGAPVDEHDHPVLPRHVRHFAQILAKNRTGDWELRFR